MVHVHAIREEWKIIIKWTKLNEYKLSNNLEKEESRLLIKEILYSNKEKIPLICIYFSDKSRQLNSRAMKWILHMYRMKKWSQNIGKQSFQALPESTNDH